MQISLTFQDSLVPENIIPNLNLKYICAMNFNENMIKS